jgi:hypothetical protein
MGASVLISGIWYNVSVAVTVAVGVNGDGRREVLGMAD